MDGQEEGERRNNTLIKEQGEKTTDDVERQGMDGAVGGEERNKNGMRDRAESSSQEDDDEEKMEQSGESEEEVEKEEDEEEERKEKTMKRKEVKKRKRRDCTRIQRKVVAEKKGNEGKGEGLKSKIKREHLRKSREI